MCTLHYLTTELHEILKSKIVFQELLNTIDHIFVSLVLLSDCIFLFIPKQARLKEDSFLGLF